MSHPLSITRSKVIINSNDMHSFAKQCIQIYRHDSYQCFSFSGFHFRDCSVMKDDSSKQLNIIRYHIPSQHLTFHFNLWTDHSFTGLFHSSKCFRQKSIQSFSLSESLFEFLSLSFDLSIRKRIVSCRKYIYLFYYRLKLVELFLIIISSYPADNFCKHCFLK